MRKAAIHLTPLRDLTLTTASEPGRPAHLSAASGLVCAGAFLYVIADDENHLGVFRGDDDRPGTLFPLIAGPLPLAAKARKREKADFETLTRLPPSAAHPHGALLAAGSGSRANRRKGALIGLDAHGALHGAARIVDLACLLAPLDATYPDLNIEGMVVIGPELRLFQRGNKKHRKSAMIRFPLAPVLRALHDGAGDPIAPLAHQRFDLGDVNGIPLTFTDATALPNGETVFTAVAEDTDNAYQDGQCAGAAIGLIGADGTLRWMRRLSHAHKIEGVHATQAGDNLDLLLVSDADDAAICARLWSARATYSSP